MMKTMATLLIVSGVLSSTAPAAEVYSTTEDYIWQERFAERLKVARAGNAEAQFNIGEMYEKGSGVLPDLKSAFTWFELAAKQGHQKAQYKIAYMYYRGEGVTANPAKAFPLMERLASNGYVRAQYYLAVMHETGAGTARNLEQARMWYSRAAAGGYITAAEALADKKRFPPQASSEIVSAPRQSPTVPNPSASPTTPAGASLVQNPSPVNLNPLPPNTESITAALRSEVTRGAQIALGSGRPAARLDALTLPLTAVAGLQPTPLHPALYVTLAKGNWVSQTNLPVEFLPSQLTSCAVSSENMIECVSRDLIKTIGEAEIGYQTQATVHAVQPTGEFKVTYRNNIVKINRRDDSTAAAAPGADKKIKLGLQDTEHRLDCKFENEWTIQCVKNQTQKITLTNQTAL